MPPVDLLNPAQPVLTAHDGGGDAARHGGALPSVLDGTSHRPAAGGAAPSSWLEPCECPGDCLRDHQLD